MHCSIEPARPLAVETLTLERTLSDLVNLACGLTPFPWKDAPFDREQSLCARMILSRQPENLLVNKRPEALISHPRIRALFCMAQETAKSVPLPVPVVAPELVPLPRLALGLLIGFAAVKLLAHFLTVAVTPYGIHRDEFLYLAMGEHLRLWGMDFPPAIALLAKAARSLFGDTLLAIRFFPAVAGTCILVLAGVIARELGGGRLAQGLAMLGVFFCSVFLRPSVLFHPVVFDQLCWTLGFLALIKIVQRSRGRWWLALSVAGGLGLLAKFSIGFFAFAMLAALLLTQQRRALATPWPYLAVMVALLVGSPSIVGQVRLDFPVVLNMRDLQGSQLQRITAFEFLLGQVLMLGPSVLLAGAGLVYLLVNRTMRPYRVVGLTCVLAFLILLLLHGKPYYAGPIYPTLIAAGAVAFGRFPGRLGRAAVIGVTVLVVAWGALVLPFGLPVVPPAPMARYAAALGIRAATTTNRGTALPLPQDYADMLGWEDQVCAVAQAYESLPADQRAQAVLLALNYGQAGALEFFGPRHGLPRRVLLPHSALLWRPPPGGSFDVAVSVGIPPEELGRYLRTVRLVGRFDHPWMVDEERHVPICVADTVYRDVQEVWAPRKR
jgi:4-amino-4-deoxy-L-arabinose transferase-like glycosyltransferase